MFLSSASLDNIHFNHILCSLYYCLASVCVLDVILFSSLFLEMLNLKPTEISEIIMLMLSQCLPMFLYKCILEESVWAILMLSFLMISFVCTDPRVFSGIETNKNWGVQRSGFGRHERLCLFNTIFLVLVFLSIVISLKSVREGVENSRVHVMPVCN